LYGYFGAGIESTGGDRDISKPSADVSVPPLVPMVAFTSVPAGLPASVIRGISLVGVGVASLSSEQASAITVSSAMRLVVRQWLYIVFMLIVDRVL